MNTQLGMKKELMLKRYPYCNINNTLIKEDIYKFNDIDEFIDYIKQSCVDKDDRLFYGEYYIDINMAMSLEEIKKYIEGTITDIQEYEVKDKPVRGLRRNANFYEESAELPTYMGFFYPKDKEDIKPIDFKYLLEREKDKYNVIYGLFNNILEANLGSIKEAIGDKYNAEIQYNKSKANVLCVTDYDAGRCCYIKYENVNPHKTFQELTKEEIEEYLQRIVIGFVMEYDK